MTTTIRVEWLDPEDDGDAVVAVELLGEEGK